LNRFNWNLRGLLNLVVKTSCPLCQRSTEREFCLDCQRQIQRCQLNHNHLFPLGQPSVFAWGYYGGALKRAITALKYENNPHLARPLGHWLGEAWLTVKGSSSGLTVVPIPLHIGRQEQRGFNQAALLANHFCEVSRLPLELKGLERTQETVAQFKLSAAEREQNLSHAFQVGKAFLDRPPCHPILLLDDVYTTGATIRSATQTLHQHGIRVYGVAVLARAQQEKGKTERN